MNKVIEPVDVSIKWPLKWTLVGSSGSGKTNFALNIIKKSVSLFDQKPDRVIIIYKVFQEIYNAFDEYYPTSLFTEEECNIEELTKSNTERLLIICDDLYFSKKLDEISEHFLIKGRHRNTSWIVLTQSIFNQPALKNISRNSTHMTLFKNVRLNEPHILFSQLRPRSSKVLQNIYAEATEEPYGYLDVDLSQTCPDKLRYKTNLFDSVVKVFVIMSDTSFKTMYLVNKSLLDENRSFKLSIRNKDICSDGMNVTVKPIKQRKSNRINVNKESDHFDDNIGKDGSDNDDGDSNDDKQRSKYNNINENQERPFTAENELAVVKYPSEIIHTVDPTHLKPQHDPAHQFANNRSSSLKRKKADSFYQQNRRRKRTKILNNTSPSMRKSNNKIMKRYRLNKYEKRLRKRHVNDSSTASPQAHHQDETHSVQKLDNHEHQRIDIDSDNQSMSERESNEDNEAEIHENPSPLAHDQNDDSYGKRIENNKRKKIEDKSDDQWMSGLKSRLNERRVQFKRKNDTIGYRVLPDDESKSIIKPSDFRFLDPVTSSELLGKWKPLKELKRKQPGTKRHKPTRSFSVWKEPNN